MGRVTRLYYSFSKSGSGLEPAVCPGTCWKLQQPDVKFTDIYWNFWSSKSSLWDSQSNRDDCWCCVFENHCVCCIHTIQLPQEWPQRTIFKNDSFVRFFVHFWSDPDHELKGWFKLILKLMYLRDIWKRKLHWCVFSTNKPVPVVSISQLWKHRDAMVSIFQSTKKCQWFLPYPPHTHSPSWSSSRTAPTASPEAVPW